MEHIQGAEINFDICIDSLLSRDADGNAGEIHTSDLPSSPGERKARGTGTASEVQGTTRGIFPNEFFHFGWDDAAIPGWVMEVPQVKKQASEKAHFRVSPTLAASIPPTERQSSFPSASKKMKVGVY